MPIDIRQLRVDQGGDPESVRESQRRRFADVALVDKVMELDAAWRQGRGQLDQLAKERNNVQKQVAVSRKAGKQDVEGEARIKAIGEEVKAKQAEVASLEAEVARLLPKIGNIVAPDVPTSNDEEKDNEVIATHGNCPTGSHYLHHHEVLYRIGGYEPERGVQVAGHRAYFLRDAGLLLSQALIQFGLAFLVERGYSVLQPPYFMNKDVMAGVAQLEQFDEELYKVGGEGGDEKYLIATSEQPLCAFHKGEWMEEAELPKRYGGISMCFRKEAGAHGKDTWGIFRVHQFEKVEQFVIVEGDFEKSDAMHHEMLKAAQEFYQALGLSYRVVNIVSGELNNAAIKKYDLEAWFPGYEEYRELVSCSNCTDYQSRAMEIRSGQKKTGQTEKKYVHMLNATLCATTRTVSCILENFQTPEGVNVPPALQPYMGGRTFIPFVRELPSALKEAKGATKGGLAVGGKAPAAAAAAKPKEAAAAKPKAAAAPAAVAAAPSGPGADIAAQIAAVGDQIRDLKKAKADKAALQPHIDNLLSLKKQYKDATGSDYAAPGAAPAKPAAKAAPAAAKAAAAPAAAATGPGASIAAEIAAVGDAIRDLKKSKADKAALQPHIDKLLALKAQYKEATGADYAAPGAAPPAAAAPAAKKADKKSDKPEGGKGGEKGKAAPAPAAVAASSGPKPCTAISASGAIDFAALNAHLLAHAYVGGWVPSSGDARATELVAALSATETKAARAHPNVARWLDHMLSFAPAERAAWK